MIPTILYKYREDSLLTEQIIINRKVWLSTAEKLNDPVECKTGIIPSDWKRQTIAEMESAQIQGMLGMPPREPETLFSLDRRRTKKWFKRFWKLTHEKRIREMRAIYQQHGIELSNPRKLFEALQQQLSAVGIFSLCECPDNQPMWAHYAANHTGLALGFASNESSKLKDSSHTLPVIYSAEKPTFKTGFLNRIEIFSTNAGYASEQKFSFDDPVFRASISTKPPGWSYEREWRYVEETSGLHEFPGDLASIVFGYRMPEDRRKYYKSLLTQSIPAVNLFEIGISPTSNFELRRLHI